MLRVFSHVLTMHSGKLVEALAEYYGMAFYRYGKAMKLTPTEQKAIDETTTAAARWMVANILLEGIALANARTMLTPSLTSFDVYGDAMAEYFTDPALENHLSPNVTVGEFFAHIVSTRPLSALLEGAMQWFVEQFMDEVYNLLGKDSFMIDNYTGIYMTRDMLIKQMENNKVILPFIEPLEWTFIAIVKCEDAKDAVLGLDHAFVVQGDAFILPETFPTMLAPKPGEDVEVYELLPRIVEELKKL